MPILGEKLRFNRANVELAPATTGVYALYVDGEIAYYGAAGGRATIRARLAEHLVGSSQPSRSSAHQFSFEPTKFPLSRECALLEEHKRQKWRLPTYNLHECRVGAARASRIEADDVLRCVAAELTRAPARALKGSVPAAGEAAPGRAPALGSLPATAIVPFRPAPAMS